MESRSLLSFFTAREIVVCFATITAGCALCLAGRRSRTGMMFLSILGLWLALANVTALLVALQPVPNYSYFYVWAYARIGESLLSSLLAIEITAVLLPRKQFALAWCGGLATLLALAIGSTLPVKREVALLNASLAADFICALVLTAILFTDQLEIPRQFRFIVAGVLVPAVVHAMGAISWLDKGLSPVIQTLLPVASLCGLLLFLIGSLHDTSDTWRSFGSNLKKRIGIARASRDQLQVSLVR